MKHLEEFFAGLPEEERRKIEQHAEKQGRSRLDYLGELLEADMERRSASIRHKSREFRFAKDEDFSVKTFVHWLKNRHH